MVDLKVHGRFILYYQLARLHSHKDRWKANKAYLQVGQLKSVIHFVGCVWRTDLV